MKQIDNKKVPTYLVTISLALIFFAMFVLFVVGIDTITKNHYLKQQKSIECHIQNLTDSLKAKDAIILKVMIDNSKLHEDNAVLKQQLENNSKTIINNKKNYEKQKSNYISLDVDSRVTLFSRELQNRVPKEDTAGK